MMSHYSEVEILAVAIKILEESGELTTTELKEALIVEMKPSGEDLQINLNRNDTKFEQKVRNMVSHRASNELLNYCDYRRSGNNGILKAKSVKAIERSEEKAAIARRRMLKRQFTARKVDFEAINSRNSEIGYLGECFVLEQERQQLPKELADKIRHISAVDGDGAGYDILSYTLKGTPKFLEVKTTTGGAETPFYLSENERLFLEIYGEDAEIVRVYDFERSTNTGKMIRIKGSDFLRDIDLKPTTYRATLKK
jgi:NAD kinase